MGVERQDCGCSWLLRPFGADASCSLRLQFCHSTPPSAPLCQAHPSAPPNINIASRRLAPTIHNRTTLAIMRLVTQAFARPRLSQQRSLLSTVAGQPRLTNNGFFRVSEEVREALHSKKPVVALETTIYTHGIWTDARKLAINLHTVQVFLTPTM